MGSLGMASGCVSDHDPILSEKQGSSKRRWKTSDAFAFHPFRNLTVTINFRATSSLAHNAIASFENEDAILRRRRDERSSRREFGTGGGGSEIRRGKEKTRKGRRIGVSTDASSRTRKSVGIRRYARTELRIARQGKKKRKRILRSLVSFFFSLFLLLVPFLGRKERPFFFRDFVLAIVRASTSERVRRRGPFRCEPRFLLLIRSLFFLSRVPFRDRTRSLSTPVSPSVS